MGGPPPSPPAGEGGGRFFFLRIFFIDFFSFIEARKGRGPEKAKKSKSRVFENVTKTRFSRFFKSPGTGFFL